MAAKLSRSSSRGSAALDPPARSAGQRRDIFNGEAPPGLGENVICRHVCSQAGCKQHPPTGQRTQACTCHSPQAFSLSCSSMAFSPVAPEVDWMISQVSWSAANLQGRTSGQAGAASESGRAGRETSKCMAWSGMHSALLLSATPTSAPPPPHQRRAGRRTRSSWLPCWHQLLLPLPPGAALPPVAAQLQNG